MRVRGEERWEPARRAETNVGDRGGDWWLLKSVMRGGLVGCALGASLRASQPVSPARLHFLPSCARNMEAVRGQREEQEQTHTTAAEGRKASSVHNLLEYKPAEVQDY